MAHAAFIDLPVVAGAPLDVGTTLRAGRWPSSYRRGASEKEHMMRLRIDSDWSVPGE
jgi:hypothetical protein